MRTGEEEGKRGGVEGGRVERRVEEKSKQVEDIQTAIGRLGRGKAEWPGEGN